MESIKSEKKNLGVLSLTALGIVFGDIGTSPLYAVRECFYGGFSVEPNTANIMGAISLIFWALIIVISLKYLILILRADNKGEGGILALMHLVLPKNKRSKNYILMSAMGLFGAALLYGDGMITLQTKKCQYLKLALTKEVNLDLTSKLEMVKLF